MIKHHRWWLESKWLEEEVSLCWSGWAYRRLDGLNDTNEDCSLNLFCYQTRFCQNIAVKFQRDMYKSADVLHTRHSSPSDASDEDGGFTVEIYQVCFDRYLSENKRNLKNYYENRH